MARKQTPQPLDVSSITTDPTNPDDSSLTSPSLRSPKSPRSPFRFSAKLGGSGQQQLQSFGEHPSMQPSEQREYQRNTPSSPTTASVPTFHAQASARQEGYEQDTPPASTTKGGFFSNYKASKSSSRLQPSDTIRPIAEGRMSRDSDRPTMLGQVSASEAKRHGSEAGFQKSLTRRPVGSQTRSGSEPALSLMDSGAASPPSSTSSSTLTKKNKPKPFSLLNRTKSIRSDKDGHSPNDVVPITITEPDRAQTFGGGGIRTAPLRPEYDRSFREIMSSSSRNRSADRQPSGSRAGPDRDFKDTGKSQGTPLGTAFRETGGNTFLSNLKSSSSKAVNISKGLFGKVGRSYSTTEKEPVVDDEHYQLKVINLPLVEQTRLTRISKKLEDSRDKTEFWMPSFPWRAIDYLNYRGTETEGLYRVPGSGPQIKKWQRRFDEELDIDLFEQEDLYDINIIGSMLKAWLRELPDELFPKAAQDRIARECAGAETVPPQLIEELSNLRPYNYYLLFAITCHLSLLLAHSAKNKMDFRNLCICFQPCMKIDAFCFKFLVVDWNLCWKGCKTEQGWIEQEYQIFDMVPPSSGEGRSSNAVESHDERNISSSDSSKPSSVSVDTQNSRTEGYLTGAPYTSKSSHLSTDTSSTSMTVQDPRTPPRVGELQPLSPIQPLSPMNF